MYPSVGKLIIGLRISGSGDDAGEWVYLTASPQVDVGAQVLQFANLALTTDSSASPGSPLAGLLGDPTLIQGLQQQLKVTLKDKMQAIIASANVRLNRPLADGFRSEGNLAVAGFSRVSLLSDEVRIEFRAAGDLRLLYGL